MSGLPVTVIERLRRECNKIAQLLVPLHVPWLAWVHLPFFLHRQPAEALFPELVDLENASLISGAVHQTISKQQPVEGTGAVGGAYLDM